MIIDSGNSTSGPPVLPTAPGSSQHAPCFNATSSDSELFAASVQAPSENKTHDTVSPMVAGTSSTGSSSSDTAQLDYLIGAISITLNISVNVNMTGGEGVEVSNIQLSEEDDRHLKSYILKYVTEHVQRG